jgi:small subunit ribosomal protein S4e
LAKKGGSNRLKRISSPKEWDIKKKEKRFIIKPSPGPYSISRSYPLGVVLRDHLKMVTNARELRYVISSGTVLVDGKKRHSLSFPVGLFTIVEVPKEGVAYRLLPSPDGLVTSRVSGEEVHLKLCSIRSKIKSKGGHIQYGFHDGRVMVNDSLSLSPSDAVLMKVPEQSVVSSVKLAKGSLGLIISGERAGQVGKVTDVRKGSITREKMVVLSLPTGETELPARLVFPVGSERPVIGVQVAS